MWFFMQSLLEATEKAAAECWKAIEFKLLNFYLIFDFQKETEHRLNRTALNVAEQIGHGRGQAGVAEYVARKPNARLAGQTVKFLRLILLAAVSRSPLKCLRLWAPRLRWPTPGSLLICETFTLPMIEMQVESWPDRVQWDRQASAKCKEHLSRL